MAVSLLPCAAMHTLASKPQCQSSHQKKRPRRAVFFQAAVTTQAVVSLAFSTYSSIWSKFMYL